MTIFRRLLRSMIGPPQGKPFPKSRAERRHPSRASSALTLVLERPRRKGEVKMHLEGGGAPAVPPAEVLPESFVAFLNSSDGVVDFIHAMSNLTARREKSRPVDPDLDLPPEEPASDPKQVRIRIQRPGPAKAGPLQPD